MIQLIQRNEELFTLEERGPDGAPASERDDEKPAEAVVRLAGEHGIILFRDQFTEPCTYLKTSQERETMDVRRYKLDLTHSTPGNGHENSPSPENGQENQVDANDASSFPKSPGNEYNIIYVYGGSLNNKSLASVAVGSVIDVWQVHRLRSRFISDFLSALFYRKTGKAAGKDQINSAISILAGQAQGKPQTPLWNRAAPDGEGGVWLDMSNDRWEAIHVTREGWEVVSRPPILFRRYPHQKPMVRPAPGGNLASLLDFCNLSSVDDQLLFLVIAVHYLIPGFPHIGVCLWGTHGSVKSTQQRLVKALIDPSSVGLLSMPGPNDMAELIQQLDHHYLPFYDNVTSVSNDQSDTLSRAITGIGNQRRALYTDDDTYLREFQRCVSLNGINVPASNPDFLNRFVVMECPYLPEAYRRSEKELEAEFNEKAPYILGAMLDSVVKALNVYPGIEEKVVAFPRMADATLWCCAIAEALGVGYRFFLNAYRVNIGEVEESTVRSSPIGEPLLAFLEVVLKDRETVTVTATQLLTTLKQYAEAEGQSLKTGDFPPDSTRLSKELNKIKANLPKMGYHLRDDRGDGKARRKVFTRIKSTKLTENYTPAQRSVNTWSAEDLRHVLDPETYRRDGSRARGGKQVVGDDVPERRLAQDEGTGLAAEAIQRGETQSPEALEGEQAKAENETSPRYESGHTVNVQDLYMKAVKVLKEAGGRMWAGEFWDALEKLGHPRKLAEYPLKNPDSPVEFVGLHVKLKEAEP
ncbi:MAG: hypothetical protein ABIJ47_10855 [Candidatus Bathyarchaeota archaeon]